MQQKKSKSSNENREGSIVYFELSTPRDMLEKTRREHQRLTECFNIDNVFNFFVTAYHIRDYIQVKNAIAQVTLETFLKDQDMQDCRDLCDKGKHLVLTQRINPTTHVWKGCMGGAPLGTLPMGSYGKWVLFRDDGREVDVKRLAKRVLDKWDVFFANHGL